MAKVDDVFKDPQGLLAGQVYGQVPLAAGATGTFLPDTDARAIGIARLLEFFARLRFTRYVGPGLEPQPYNIPKESLLDEQPPDIVKLLMPAISVLPTIGTTSSGGLGPATIDDDTIDKFGPGTALLDKGTYTEILNLEVWASSKIERRSIVAGVTAALTCSEDSYGMRLTLPDYFGLIADYTLQESGGSSQYVDDPDVIRNRRRAMIFVEMRVPVAQLVRATRMKPRIQVDAIAPNRPELKLSYPGSPDPKNGPER